MNKHQAGFSLIELLIVIALVGLVGIMFFNFFSLNLGSYLRLQNDASQTAVVASQSQRIASVLRGATGIVSATDNDLSLYAYFYPSDTYVSLVHYYLASGNTILYCDVTPMSSNPPTGMPITTKKQTYKIADNFNLASGSTVFTYFNGAYGVIAPPIADLNSIKIIQTNLAVQDSNKVTQNLSLQVALRNRKTNL